MKTMELFSLILQGIGIIVVVLLSIHRTVRTKSIIKGGLFAYAMLILWGFSFCLLLPVVFNSLGYKKMALYFPEGSGFAGMIGLGWIHGFVLASLTRALQVLITRFAPKKESANNE
jgi:hypothetical protein